MLPVVAVPLESSRQMGAGVPVEAGVVHDEGRGLGLCAAGTPSPLVPTSPASAA